MATLRDIRGRIKGVKSTQQITKAMKMVAAAKMRKAQDRMHAARPYSKKVKELLSNLAGGIDTKSHPLMEKRSEIKNVAILIITSDRGLCGAFNSNLIRQTVAMINSDYKLELESGHLHMITIGRKSFDYFRKRGYKIAHSDIGLFGNLGLNSARSITSHIVEGYLSGKYDLVISAFNEFKNVATTKIEINQMIPIQINAEKKASINSNYIFEPDQTAIVDSLIPMQLQTQVWQMLLESFAAEQGARMTAMDSATENAKELIKVLSLNYNRLRQAAITREIAEIVSGAESLKA